MIRQVLCLKRALSVNLCVVHSVARDMLAFLTEDGSGCLQDANVFTPQKGRNSSVEESRIEGGKASTTETLKAAAAAYPPKRVCVIAVQGICICCMLAAAHVVCCCLLHT